MAMGKVIILKELVEATPVVETSPAVEMAPVIEQAPVIEPVATEKLDAVEQATVETPEAELSAKPEVTTEVVETQGDATPVKTEETEETEVDNTEVDNTEDKQEVISAPMVEVEEKAQTKPAVKKAKPAKLKAHASSVMTKAPGPQEIKEIEVKAAPLKEERYQPKGAGSQAARSQSSASMSKTM
jgi:ribonuclease E